ncbi:MAG: Rieske (2Fe-2S) protein [Thermodesulfobacteriota bacterium]
MVEESKIKRRDVLTTLWRILGGAALFGFLGSGLFFFKERGRKSGPDPSRELVAGPEGDFPPASVTRLSGGCFLSRLEDGGILALSMLCSHLGCAISWDKGNERFICPCHGSTFDRRGDVIVAPAPRALAYFPVRLKEGVIIVDLGRPVKRAAFAPDQPVYVEKG